MRMCESGLRIGGCGPPWNGILRQSITMLREGGSPYTDRHVAPGSNNIMSFPPVPTPLAHFCSWSAEWTVPMMMMFSALCYSPWNIHYTLHPPILLLLLHFKYLLAQSPHINSSRFRLELGCGRSVIYTASANELTPTSLHQVSRLLTGTSVQSSC